MDHESGAEHRARSEDRLQAIEQVLKDLILKYKTMSDCVLQLGITIETVIEALEAQKVFNEGVESSFKMLDL